VMRSIKAPRQKTKPIAVMFYGPLKEVYVRTPRPHLHARTHARGEAPPHPTTTTHPPSRIGRPGPRCHCCLMHALARMRAPYRST
jgi:hypothetical protein